MRLWISLLLLAAFRYCASCADAFAFNPDVPCKKARKLNTVKMRKPLGIILEEVDATDPSKGVCVGSIDGKSNAASCGTDVCIHDQIVAVNGADCLSRSFEEVMDLIVSCEAPEVEVTLARLEGRVSVRWPNGVCVAAPVGEYLGNVANEARFDLPYSCRSGSCGSCEQHAVLDNKREKKLRPCSTKVPKGVETIEFLSQH
jgi:ferredoxin